MHSLDRLWDTDKQKIRIARDVKFVQRIASKTDKMKIRKWMDLTSDDLEDSQDEEETGGRNLTDDEGTELHRR